MRANLFWLGAPAIALGLACSGESGESSDTTNGAVSSANAGAGATDLAAGQGGATSTTDTSNGVGTGTGGQDTTTQDTTAQNGVGETNTQEQTTAQDTTMMDNSGTTGESTGTETGVGGAAGGGPGQVAMMMPPGSGGAMGMFPMPGAGGASEMVEETVETGGAAMMEEESTDTGSEEDPAAALFAEHGCATCHGEDGGGTDALGPEVLHPIPIWADHVVANGIPGTTMVAQDVPAEDMAIINEWLSAAPQPTDGAGLYMDYCANCHGEDGTKVGGHSLVGEAGEVTTDGGGIVRAGHGNPGDMHYMPPIPADLVSDEEVALIAGHVGTL